MSARTFRILALPAALWLSAGAALAQTESAAADSTLFVAVPADQAAAAAPAAPVTALDREVAAIREAFSLRLAELTSAYRAAPDARAAAEAQRQISALKTSLELDLLDVQLRLARERRDAEALAELEAAREAAAARLPDERLPDERLPARSDDQAGHGEAAR